MFGSIAATPPDPLYAAAAGYAADPRPERIDLSVGVYRDGDGRSPVMAAVKAAERRLAAQQDSKAYRPLLGDPAFADLLGELVLGADCPAAAEHRLVTIQATGGTGALRLAAALAAAATERPRIHLGLPTWPSHAGVFAAEGLQPVEHRYWEAGQTMPAVGEIMTAARAALPDDLFLFHGPCHNPTGIDLSPAERRALLHILRERGAVPVLDIAYYGLAGGLEPDLEIARDLIARSRRAIVALSCSKAFGLYRERTGLLFILCESSAEASRVRDRLGRISRLLVSTPPAHGAEVVAQILRDPELAADWRAELEAMRQRILALRATLAASGLPALAPLGDQRGIFAMLPLDAGQVRRLAIDHAIHMPPSGRANLVGLRDRDVAPFVAALAAVGCGGAGKGDER